MDIDLNSEPQDADDVSNTHGQVQKAGGEVKPHQQKEGDEQIQLPRESDYVLQETGTATDASIGEPTGNTAGTNEGNCNEDIDDAHSTPQPPAAAMCFDSFESAKEHYRAYAQRTGYGIRIDWSKKDHDGEYQKVNLVCSNAGKNYEPKEDTQNPKGAVKRRRKSTHPRTGCEAHMFLKRKDAWYYVEEFTDDHNHELLIKPSLTRFLRSHRNIPEEEKDFLRLLWECNIPTSRQMQLMAKFYGKLNDVPYIEKDVANLKTTFKHQTTNHDMQDLLAYFDQKKAEDKDFFVKIKLDKEDRVENIFWVDGAARRAYKSGYNDCISFDTTYLTNKYKMPCAPFIGINNHGQSIQLGCGFIRQELSDNFVWLFRMFKLAMGGLELKNIITDQDTGMKSAISDVFPDASHRNCRWHVIQNATEKLGSFMARHPELLEAFNACINNSLTPDEFETSWISMVNEHGVADNVDLYALWEQRKVWVPAYFMHNFYPFLQTTARSEGFNAVLKKYVRPSNTLYEFVQQYMDVQDKILNAELKQMKETAITDPDWWCGNAMERQMAKIYTRNIFNRFQKELPKSFLYQCDHLNGYRFRLSITGPPVAHYGYRDYEVLANWEEQTYKCNCCKFERDGVLCCHIIKVMTDLKVHLIPETYILKRWTWDAESVLGGKEDANHPDKQEIPEEARNMMMFASFRDDFRKMCQVGLKTEDGKKIIRTHLKAMKQELNVIVKREQKKAEEAEREAITMPSSSAPNTHMPQTQRNTEQAISYQGGVTATSTNTQQASRYHGGVPATSTSGSNIPSTRHVDNPPLSVTKGRPKEIANKNPLNLATKKVKHCSFCNGTDHTLRKCQERLKLLGYRT